MHLTSARTWTSCVASSTTRIFFENLINFHEIYIEHILKRYYIFENSPNKNSSCTRCDTVRPLVRCIKQELLKSCVEQTQIMRKKLERTERVQNLCCIFASCDFKVCCCVYVSVIAFSFSCVHMIAIKK